MRSSPTPIAGVHLLEFDSARDERGGFARLFCSKILAEAGVNFTVVQANISYNIDAFTLRGVHYQTAPHGEAKIVTCLRGRIFDVAVDLREDSPTYRQWTAVELSEEDPRGFYLPRGIAHGFLTLERDSVIHYLMDAPYHAASASGVRWDDPAFGIDWPAEPLIISERDRNHPLIVN